MTLDRWDFVLFVVDEVLSTAVVRVGYLHIWLVWGLRVSAHGVLASRCRILFRGSMVAYEERSSKREPSALQPLVWIRGLMDDALAL